MLAAGMNAQQTLFTRMVATRAPRSVILVRLVVGAVFLSEGIQKFLFPELLGEGRFTRIGIPSPEVMGPFVGAVEIVGGALVLLGLLTRLVAIPLVIDISVAVISTKIPILLGHDYGRFHVAKLARYGFWSMASEGRTDFLILFGLLFLLIVGAGPWSVDVKFAGWRAPTSDGPADKPESRRR